MGLVESFAKVFFWRVVKWASWQFHDYKVQKQAKLESKGTVLTFNHVLTETLPVNK